MPAVFVMTLGVFACLVSLVGAVHFRVLFGGDDPLSDRFVLATHDFASGCEEVDANEVLFIPFESIARHLTCSADELTAASLTGDLELSCYLGEDVICPLTDSHDGFTVVRATMVNCTADHFTVFGVDELSRQCEATGLDPTVSHQSPEWSDVYRYICAEDKHKYLPYMTANQRRAIRRRAHTFSLRPTDGALLMFNGPRKGKAATKLATKLEQRGQARWRVVPTTLEAQGLIENYHRKGHPGITRSALDNSHSLPHFGRIAHSLRTACVRVCVCVCGCVVSEGVTLKRAITG